MMFFIMLQILFTLSTPLAYEAVIPDGLTVALNGTQCSECTGVPFTPVEQFLPFKIFQWLIE
jgi:hypothetical protein